VKPSAATCRRCAQLAAADAKVRHGPEGDNCWDERRCHSRRSYARHRDRRNQTRNNWRWSGQVTVALSDQPVSAETLNQVQNAPDLVTLSFQTELPNTGFTAVLQVYRRAVDAPLMAVGGEVWQAGNKVAEIVPIGCALLTPRQVEIYVERLLKKLAELYGIRRFAALEERPPAAYQTDAEDLRPA
jgi:hypothetical protein